MGYKLIYTPRAKKDAGLLERAKLDENAIRLLSVIKKNPYQNPPPYEKLIGDFKGTLSRRINKKHRIVYDVLPNNENVKDENGAPYQGIVKVIRMWTHYE